MQNIKINRLHFSPTGSTEKVVNIISDVFNGEKSDIDFSVANENYSNYFLGKKELCFIGVPSFGGRVPTVALEHLKQIKWTNTPTVLVGTYGNCHYDDTLLELKETLAQNGFHVVAVMAAVTEHSIMSQFGTGKPDESDKTYRVYNGLPLKQK